MTRKELMAVACVAGCECRTIKKFVEGKRVQKRFLVPIIAALKQLGYPVGVKL